MKFTSNLMIKGIHLEPVTPIEPQVQLNDSILDKNLPIGTIDTYYLPRPCPHCPKILKTRLQFRQHLRCHKERKIHCEICSKKFVYPSDLTQHKKRRHSDASNMSYIDCNICGKSCKELSMYHHMRTHTKYYKHKCDKCDRAFPSPSELNQHNMIQHEGFRYNCTTCNKNFKDRSSYKAHLISHDLEKKGNETEYKCDECGKITLSQRSFNLHKLRHSQKVICELCGKVLANLESYREHMHRHNGEKPYVCEVCNKGFCGRTEMEAHRRVHTKEKPYACRLCDKRFSQAGTLKVHTRGHTGEKPFQCDICQKRFVTRTILKYHRQKHQAT